MADRQRFPIIGGPSIPWAMIAPHERQALENHDQSLQTLAIRGGLDPSEAIAVLDDRKWHRMDHNVAYDDLSTRLKLFTEAKLGEEITDLKRQLAEALQRVEAAERNRNPCQSCGADPSVSPATGQELPIIRGALDAQAKAEQATTAALQRAEAAEAERDLLWRTKYPSSGHFLDEVLKTFDGRKVYIEESYIEQRVAEACKREREHLRAEQERIEAAFREGR